MCSIAGAKDVGKVSEMLSIMKHRAPQGSMVIPMADFEMGMGRLAIIDVANTEFPFVYDGKVLAFNGEIYNYIELREELKGLGHVFRTEGDTEVLIHAYAEWGEACLDKLNGMFAFAIYDDGEIFLARDIAGEKPLYFSRDGFKFASEAKALHWRCEEFPPAHAMIYRIADNTFRMWEWWTFTKREINVETAEAELEALLEDSIRLRTRSDVPYALYLSDGVDSNLINSFAKKPFSTFTYVDRLHDEEEFHEVMPRIVWHLDYPLDSFSSFGLWDLARRAQGEGFRVVLSGEGADELFGGYIRYVPHGMNLKARDLYPSYKEMFPVKHSEDPGFSDFRGKMRGLLRMGDRMASAWGIENRCPFLDRRIIEFAFSLPDELRAYGFDTKIILKRILARRNPNYKFVEKHGLNCSVNRWLGVDEVLSKGAYLAYQNRLWRKFQ